MSVNVQNDILLINPGIFSGTRSYGSMLHEPTMGLYLLRDYLSEKGFKVEILDGTYQAFNDTEILKKARISKVIGFYAVYTNMEKIYRLSPLIKQENSDAIIIVGGPNWPAAKEILMTAPGVDIVIKDGAEESIINILLQLRDKKHIRPETLNGVFFRSGNTVTDTGDAFHSSIWAGCVSVKFEVLSMRKTVLKLITSKGCPNNCKFCPSPKWMELSSMKDAVNVIENAWERGIDTFYIADENFCPPNLTNRVIKFCDLIMNSNIVNRPINLKLFLEPQTPLNILKKLSQVASINAFVGFESFSDRTLTFFGKKSSRRINLLFWKNAEKFGINILPGIITLHPFLTPEELIDTIKILDMHDALSWRLLLKKMDLYPGTVLLTKMKTEFSNLLKSDFSPLLRPSHWDYSYDQGLGKPLLSKVEKFFSALADKEELKELYALISDLGFMAEIKNDKIKKLYYSLRAEISNGTKGLALDIIKTIAKYPDNFEKQLEPSISQYFCMVKGNLANIRDLFYMVIGEKDYPGVG